MKQQQKTWVIAAAAAIAGAAVTHVSWSVREHEPAPRTDAVSQAASEPRPERVCPGAPPAAASSGARAAPASAQPAHAEPPPSMLGKLGEWQPTAQLSPQQRKTMVRNQYGALLQELALPPGQTERLLDVLSEQQTRRRPPGAKRDGAGVAQDAEDAASREQAEIAAAIGTDKAAAFEQLRETLPLRAELRRVRDQLEDAGDPITAEQQRALLAALSAGGLARPPGPGEGESLEESAQLYGDWVGDRDDVLRESAAKILSPSQLKTLEESKQLHDAMRPQLGAASGPRAPAGG